MQNSSQCSTANISVDIKGKKSLGTTEMEKRLKNYMQYLLMYIKLNVKICSVQFCASQMKQGISIFRLETPSGLTLAPLFFNIPSIQHAIFGVYLIQSFVFTNQYSLPNFSAVVLGCQESFILLRAVVVEKISLLFYEKPLIPRANNWELTQKITHFPFYIF